MAKIRNRPLNIEEFSADFIDRFWSRVAIKEPGDCWPWTGPVRNNGYGQVNWKDHSVSTHRLAYLFGKGPIPEGLCICHACDNRICCNPAHLWIGTFQDNALDAFHKGRRKGVDPSRVRGTASPRAKFTEADIRDIRRRYRTPGVTARLLAEEYHTHEDYIKNIVYRKRWAHLADDEGVIHG